MKSSYTTKPAFQVISGYDPNTGLVTSSTSAPGAWYAWDKQVICPPMNPGDHKSPTAWSYTTVFNNSQSGIYRMVQRGPSPNQWTQISGKQVGGVPDLSGLWTPESILYNEALDRLNKKARGELDLSVSAFQAKQTIRMFNVTESLLAFASRKANILRRVGSKWLEWQYGWKPLISDIYSVADESLRYILNESENIEGRASRKFSGSKAYQGLSQNPKVKTDKVSYTTFQACKIGVKMSRKQETNLARWTSLNPISIAWELLPYSFVVDWFYDVGGMLRATETALLYSGTFQTGYVSYLKVGKATSNDIGTWYKVSNQEDHTWNLVSQREEKTFSRTPISNWPFPRAPSLSFDLGSSRMISAAALLSQFLGRR